ncbi:MAG: hypothetical protein CMF52_02390 [Legionellales bacterium]|nr:hypothetical protein [Legionellales bacterium]
MNTFYLCDLSHTAQGINSELVPYPTGCIKSYFHANSKHDAEIKLFKYPEKLLSSFSIEKPSIVAFSNYMWNLDLSYTIAEAIKDVAPETLIVFGGPNFPLETHRQEIWLGERPAVDIHVTGEGEHPFLEIAEHWIENADVNGVKNAQIYGVVSLLNGKLQKCSGVRKDGFDDSPRIKSLDSTPSPYLMGYLDEFLADKNLVPLMECNRGCPFTCAFCVDGIGARSKVHKASLDRLKSELIYIAERYDGKYLTLADTNFGMYKDDLEFCKVIDEVKNQYNFPHHLQVTTGKNQTARIMEAGRLLKGSLRFSASVQSLDEDVLRNIKRSNISYESLIDVSRQVSNTQASTYSETILSLPGDSEKKHKNSVIKLMEAEFNQVRLYTLMILDGSELATDKTRSKFGLKTRFRVVPRSFGIYEFQGRQLRSVEVEEVCVENDTLPFDKYVECRRFALSVTLFYNDQIFFELTQFLNSKGLKVSDWVMFVHDKYADFPDKLAQVYDKFEHDTIEELSLSKEGLEEDIKSTPGAIEGYINGERGNNVLFNTQAQVYLEAMDDLHYVAFSGAKEFLEKSGNSLTPLEETYLSDLERYSLLKKSDFINIDSPLTEGFNFDFISLESTFFESVPSDKEPTKICFFYQKWQKEFISDQLKRHGESIQSVGKIFSRVPIKKLQRVSAREGEVKYDGDHLTAENLQNDQLWFGEGSNSL